MSTRRQRTSRSAPKTITPRASLVRHRQRQRAAKRLLTRASPAGALTTIKGVNKVDVVTLGSTFGSLAALMTASSEQLAACPGIGPTKVRRLHDTFHAPFRRTGPRQLRLMPAAGAAEQAAGGQEGSEAPALPPPLVPPPLLLPPLAPEDGAAGGEADEAEPYDEAEEDGDPLGEGGRGGADPTDVTFYASLDPEASDDDRGE